MTGDSGKPTQKSESRHHLKIFLISLFFGCDRSLLLQGFL